MVELRRCEKYTVYRSTEIVKLDPEKFRSLESHPYTGETDEDFLIYLEDSEFSYELPDDIDDESRNELFKIFDSADWTEYEPESKYRIQFIDSFLKSGGGKKINLLDFVNGNLERLKVNQIDMDTLNTDLKNYFSTIFDDYKIWYESTGITVHKGMGDNYSIDDGEILPGSTSYEDGC